MAVKKILFMAKPKAVTVAVCRALNTPFPPMLVAFIDHTGKSRYERVSL